MHWLLRWKIERKNNMLPKNDRKYRKLKYSNRTFSGIISNIEKQTLNIVH